MSSHSTPLILATGVLLSVQSNTNTAAGWYIGLILLGIGWNFGFSSATVWSTRSYEDAPYLKAKVQAANECLMFFLSGALMFITGYIYKAGGGEISGWRLLNGVLFVLIATYGGTLVAANRFAPKDQPPPVTEQVTPLPEASQVGVPGGT